MVAPRYAGDAVVSCHPQNVIQPNIQLTIRKCFFGASSAAQRYCAADVGDMEAYSAREAQVQRVPMKQKKKPYTRATWIKMDQSHFTDITSGVEYTHRAAVCQNCCECHRICFPLEKIRVNVMSTWIRL